MKQLYIKLNIAGSGNLNQRKAQKNGTISYENLLKQIYKDTFKEVDEKAAGYHDITNITLMDKERNKFNFKELKLKKRDFFANFESDKNENGTDKLKIIRPGPGVDYLYSKWAIARAIGNLYLDIGQYSIKKSISKCASLINHLISFFNYTYESINVKIKGHSRGGVIAEQCANKIKEYDENKVHISLSLLDPVAGGDSWNHIGLQKTELNKKLSSGLVLSVNPHRSIGFGAKEVKGAKVIILTPMGHSAGLQNTNEDKNGKYHKSKWEYNGKQYKYGEYTKLKPGIYFPAETVNLTKLGDIEDESEPGQNKKDLIIKLEKFESSNAAKKIKKMSETLKLKELWKKRRHRTDYVLSLLNEHYQNENQKIIYNEKDGTFQIEENSKSSNSNDKKESIFRSLFSYLLRKIKN